VVQAIATETPVQSKMKQREKKGKRLKRVPHHGEKCDRRKTKRNSEEKRRQQKTGGRKSRTTKRAIEV